jgi:transposase InsO family protein
MAIVLNPRRRRRRKRRNALLNPRKRRKRTKAKAKRTRRRTTRAFAGDTARPKLVYRGTRGGKKVYGRTEKSKTKFPDVIVVNPRRKRRKRNPVLTGLTDTLMNGVYGAVGIAGVNAITNLASRFVNLDNVYLRSAVKLAIAVGVPTLLKRQIGSRVAETITSVAVAYVLYELIKGLLPDNVKAMVSAIEPRYELPSRTYAFSDGSLSAVYPMDYSVSNERYEI